MEEKDRVGLSSSDALKALERFVVENEELLELESLIGRFNIFDALRIARVEIRHSNFLAFILDPVESHGQGQLFLKAILMDLLSQVPPNLRPLSPIQLDGIDLRGVEVEREWERIDLLITCREPKFAVVIENKIDSQEHSDQLIRYQMAMKERYPDIPTLFVYLTPDGDEPSEESWFPYTYADVHRVFKRVRDTYCNSIGDEVRIILNHYLDRFMNDEKLDELCKRIYKNHRQALDLIWERIDNSDSGPFAELLLLLQDGRWLEAHRSNKYVDFVPKNWVDFQNLFDPDDYYPVRIHIKSHENSLSCILYVGPMKDRVKRKEIIVELREKSPNFGFVRSTAWSVEGEWNRISGEETLLEWDEDDPESIRKNLKKKLDEIGPIPRSLNQLSTRQADKSK